MKETGYTLWGSQRCVGARRRVGARGLQRARVPVVGRVPSRGGFLIVLFLQALFVLRAGAQPNVVGNNFSAADYYKPPNDAQMKSLLQGSKAERLPDGHLLLVNELKLQAFSEKNERELLVEAPECFYDERDRSAYSPGRLRAQSGKGEVSIEGEGFLWRQTNSSLIISNRVHTMFHGGLLQSSNTAQANLPMNQLTNLEIFSDQFTYSAETGLGIYSGNVRVAGTNLSLAGGQLTLVVPLAERQLQSITAEKDVTVEYEGVRANGDRVRYEAASGQVQISGQPEHQPSWHAGDREGKADELWIDPTNKVFRANGHAWAKMVSDGQTNGGFLPGKRQRAEGRGQKSEVKNPSAGKTDEGREQTVEISCANYEVRTNSALFQQEVEVRQRTGDTAQGTMHCDTLTALFSGTNELQKIVAENHVVIELETNRFTADHAVYDGKAGVLELTGSPTWRSGPREGSGKLIALNPDREEMRVAGEARMRLPAEEISGSSAFTSIKRATTNSASSPQQFSEITADEYTLTPENAVFQGTVRADHPQMKWQCETINARFPSGTNLGQVVAEQNVKFDLTESQVRGTGRRAVFTFGSPGNASNDFLELTGNPVLVTTNGIFKNQVILMDLAKQKMIAPGRFRIEGETNAEIPGLKK